MGAMTYSEMTQLLKAYPGFQNQILAEYQKGTSVADMAAGLARVTASGPNTRPASGPGSLGGQPIFTPSGGYPGAGGMGYGGAVAGNNPIGGLEGAGGASILDSMYDNFASMNNSANARFGAENVSLNQLAGTQDTNRTNLAGIQDTNRTSAYNTGLNADANRYASFMGYSAADIQSLRNLLGIKDTNAANQNIAQTQGNAQMGTAAIGVGPKYEQLDIVRDLLGGNGNANVANFGQGGGGGGTAVNLGGNQTAQTGTGNAYSGPQAPNFRTFDDLALQRKMGSANADIAKQYDTQNQQMTNNMAGRGFSTNSPGFQSVIAQNNARKLGAMQDSNRELAATGMQYNAQNALPYAQAGMGQYNAEQDRALRYQLAQMAGQQGMLTGLLSV